MKKRESISNQKAYNSVHKNISTNYVPWVLMNFKYKITFNHLQLKNNFALMFLKRLEAVFRKQIWIWGPTRAKFCQLIVGLSVVLLRLNPTKLKLEYLKFGF